MGGTIVGDSGPRTGEGAGSMSPEDRVKARPTVLILHSMPDETERIRALLERQPADLRVTHPQRIAESRKQPIFELIFAIATCSFS